MTSKLLDHLESHLGRISRGWGDYGGDLKSLQVCRFEDAPMQGVVTYVTLGLSHHVLSMPKGRAVRQELVLAVAHEYASDDLAKLLAYVAERILGEHQAILRGDVIPLGSSVARGSELSSLYVSLPVAFPDGLATYSGTDPATVFAWLVPVHDLEAKLVRRMGWSQLEDHFEGSNPDLFDLGRASVV